MKKSHLFINVLYDHVAMSFLYYLYDLILGKGLQKIIAYPHVRIS